MSEEILFLDTNIPMYAAGEGHPYKAACVWLMEEIVEGRVEAAIDTEIIQEVLYRYGAIGCWQMGATMATNLLHIVPVIYPILVDDICRAVDLFQQYARHGVKARDVIHVAVMLNNGLNKIISTDTHFDRVEGIVRLDPRTMFSEVDGE